MSPFGRPREPLHERLAREGGLPFGGEPGPHRTEPRWGEVGIHGIHRQRQWDAVVLVEAPDVPGDEADFVALPDGSLLADEDVPDGALEPLANALEESLRPPYRAQAVRRGPALWAAAANGIEVVELSEDPGGDELELALRDGDRTFLVDGAPGFGGVRELERLGSERYGDGYAVHAERLDGPLWEVQATPL